MIFTSDIGEKVQALDCGSLNNPDYKEVVVAGFSGRVYSFTTEPILKKASDDQYGRSVQTVQNENRIKSLLKEVEDLTKRVDKEKKDLGPAALASAAREILPPEELAVSHKCFINPDLAVYEFSLELQASIDIVVIRSYMSLDFVDTDIGTAVLSNSPVIVGSAGMPDVYVYSFR